MKSNKDEVENTGQNLDEIIIEKPKKSADLQLNTEDSLKKSADDLEHNAKYGTTDQVEIWPNEDVLAKKSGIDKFKKKLKLPLER